MKFSNKIWAVCWCLQALATQAFAQTNPPAYSSLRVGHNGNGLVYVSQIPYAYLNFNCLGTWNNNNNQWSRNGNQIELVVRPELPPGQSCPEPPWIRPVSIPFPFQLPIGQYRFTMSAAFTGAPPQGVDFGPVTADFEVVADPPPLNNLRVRTTPVFSNQDVVALMYESGLGYGCSTYQHTWERQGNQVTMRVRVIPPELCWATPPPPANIEFNLGQFPPGEYTLTSIVTLGTVESPPLSTSFVVLAGSNAIPTLSGFGMSLMVLMVFGFGVFFGHRK